MKLTFEPVTNKIGDDYYIVPKNDIGGMCVMKCNDVGAFIVNLLVVNHNRDEMIAATSAQYPNATLEEVEAAVDGVRGVLKATLKKPTEDGGTDQ